MAYLGSQPNAEFGAGVNHVTNTGHENTNSVTLDGALQHDSSTWDSDVEQVATTPHSALAPYAFSRSASANGSDGGHFIPGFGFTGSGDGESTQTYGKEMSLRMAGDNSSELS